MRPQREALVGQVENMSTPVERSLVRLHIAFVRVYVFVGEGDIANRHKIGVCETSRKCTGSGRERNGRMGSRAWRRSLCVAAGHIVSALRRLVGGDMVLFANPRIIDLSPVCGTTYGVC